MYTTFPSLQVKSRLWLKDLLLTLQILSYTLKGKLLRLITTTYFLLYGIAHENLSAFVDKALRFVEIIESASLNKLIVGFIVTVPRNIVVFYVRFTIGTDAKISGVANVAFCASSKVHF